MKYVYFVRHAKSSWSNPKLTDHDRPLNDRGKHDAPRMARRAKGLGLVMDGILTSTAKRARRTARAFREAYGLPKAQVVERGELYHAYPRDIEAAIRQLPADWNSVFVFGHNPGYTDLANRLQADDYIDNVPTCGIVTSRCAVDDWSEWTVDAAERTGFYYPKQTS